MPPTAVHTPLASAATDAAASDRHLVALAARGEQRSFELLFQRHRPGVHAYALRMLADHAAAEDVVQDVFVSAMRSLRNGTEPVHVRAWLQEIARCACVDHWRGSERRREVSYDAPDSLSGKDARQMAVSGDVAMRGAADRESLAYLQSAFEDLPPLQHRVLVQRELEGRSSNEIAERLGISPTVVEGQLARGRRSLAVAFRELQSGERCVATRELCEASLDRPLGVRDRTRVRVHLRTCSSCRRHARAAGVEARLFDPRLLSHLGFLLPLPLLRRFPLSPLFASSESLGAAITSKALVGAAMIAAGGGSALVISDVGPGRASDPAPVARSAEPPATFVAAEHAVYAAVPPSAVVASTSLPLAPVGRAPEIRLAVAAPAAEQPRDRDARTEAAEKTERQRDVQGAVTPGSGRREALAGTFPTPLTLPRFVPSAPPRIQRLEPVPDGTEHAGGGSGTDTRGTRQLPVAPVVGVKIGSDDPAVAPAPEPKPEPKPEPAPEEPPVVEQPAPNPGEVEAPPVDSGETDPAPDSGVPASAPAVPDPAVERAPSAPVEPSTGEQG